MLFRSAKGFVGKNLCIELKNLEHEVLEYDLDNEDEDLQAYAQQATDPGVKQFFQKSAQSAMECKQQLMQFLQ